MTMQLGYAHAMAGEKAEAREMIDFPARLRRKTYVPSFYSGAIYTGLRDKDQAFLWLQRAYDERCDYLVHLNKSAPGPPASNPPAPIAQAAAPSESAIADGPSGAASHRSGSRPA